MADFGDLSDAQISHWAGVLNANGVEFDTEQFPWGYYLKERGQTAVDNLKTLCDVDPRKAVCQLMSVAVNSLVKSNFMDFITRRELNAEFNDLMEQGLQYGITLS